jgi:hypothetical protein
MFAFLSIVTFFLMTAYDASVEAAMLAKQRRLNLPTCEWVIKPGLSYSCFPSHCEARYLKE